MQPQTSSPTMRVVCTLIGAVLVWTTYGITNIPVFVILVCILAYEGWTLINGYENDTISEIMWILSKRPMVPCLFGMGAAWLIQTGNLNNPWLIFFTGGLFGHFFFQKAED